LFSKISRNHYYINSFFFFFKSQFCSHFDDNYRASNNVIVISFVEQVSCLLDEGSGSTESVKKPGCLGLGNELSLLNIWTTDDMFGLSSGFCCTHNKPTWICRNTLDRVHESPTNSSINSIGLSSIHSFHAWKKRKPKILWVGLHAFKLVDNY